RGLLNSTSSVVLATVEAGGTVDEGVAEARRQGVAEADPTLDLDGSDSAVKVVAIATVLMGADLALADVDVTGVGGLGADQVRVAAAAGSPVRLVATVEQDGDRVRGRVAPERLAPHDPFAHLDPTALALHFEGDLVPGLTVVGHGLTPRQTAYGVLADVLSA